MVKVIKNLEDIELPDYLEAKQIIKSYVTPLDNLISGFSPGEIVQLVGETKTGKTALALQVALGFCKQNKKVLYIDTKHDITAERLQNSQLIEYYKNYFYLVKESTFNEVDDKLNQFIKTGQIDLIIIDSLPSLINKRNIQLSGKDKINSDNKNTNSGTRPLIYLINKLKKLSIQYDMCLLFVNEYRNKVDQFYGTINKVFGPKCLDYETSSLIQIKRITSNDNKIFKEYFKSLESENIGISDELMLLKGKALKPVAPIPFFFEYGTGYQDKYEIIYQMLQNGTIVQSGTYYEFMNFKANGLVNFIQLLNDNGILQQLVDRARKNSI